MNMHVPQSITAATELKVIATLLRQIISPRLAGPIIGLFQDTGTGVFRISKPTVNIPEHIAMNILARTKKPLSNFKRLNKPMSGIDVISQAFPLTDVEGGSLSVKDGKLIKGLLNKKSISKIVHHIYLEYGPDRTAEFINAVQAIVTKFNLYTGFSTGPSDLIANSEVYSKISEILEKGKKEVSIVMSSVHSGTFLNNSGRTDGEELEKQISNKLNEINSSIGKDAIESIPSTNRMIEMSDKGSGSKGVAEMNIVQMVALLGQQQVDGKRIEYTMDNRTLPHFAKFDDGPQARGFVENSFIAGIRPAEFFFHAMGGRQGLIDTAVKTSDTGYIQRKLVKSMEDIHVAYDGTVRDVTGAIVQFAYGDDGIDSVYIEEQECELGTLTMEQVYERFAGSRSDFEAVMNEAPSSSPPDFVEQILKDRDMLVKHVMRYNSNTEIIAPVSMKKLTKKYANPYNTKTDLTPEYVIEELNKLCNEPYIRNNKLFHVLVRYYLAPKQSMIVLRMNKELFQEALREIRYKYIRSMVHAGEMVGPIAAQSIGEPTTQLTLNTFHKAGTASANGTKGVPRIQELLSASHNPKNPSNIVYLTSPRGLTQDGAITKMKEIQKTTLRDITKSVRIYYDPNSMSSNTLVSEDREILQMYEKFSVGVDQNCASPWIMRLELDIQSMLARGVNDMTMVQTKIRNNKILRVFDCMSSDINKDSKLMLRITFASDTVKNALALRFVEDKLLDTVLTGVDGIGRVFTREISYELSYDEKVGGYKKQTQYVLDTEGTNLLDLMVFPDVDHRKTTSTDIHEILEVFGIEACRQILYKEFKDVFETEKVNYHHLSVLVDTMTYHGQLVSTDRFGMNKNDSGVLARSSFEMTSKVLFDAAISGEFDPMKGVSANIMFGQKPPCGTGFVDILVDESRLPDGVEDELDTEETDLAHANAMVKAATEHGDCKLEDITMAW